MKNRDFFFTALWFEGGMAVIAVLLGLPFGLNVWESAALDLRSTLWIVGVTVPMLLGYVLCRAVPLESFRAIDRVVRTVFRDYLQMLPVWKLVGIGVLAGLGEELLFRGFLQTGLLRLLDVFVPGHFGIYGTAAVLLTVSVLFGLGHAMTKMYFFLAFSISVYFGVVFLATENILVPIAAHALYDIFVLLWYKIELDREFRSVIADSINDVEQI